MIKLNDTFEMTNGVRRIRSFNQAILTEVQKTKIDPVYIFEKLRKIVGEVEVMSHEITRHN